MYYLTNYTAKNGISSYNAVAYAITGFLNVKKYDNIENLSCLQQANRFMSAAYNAAANKTEYSGVQVANMLLNNGIDGTSHKNVPLNIYPM